MQTQSLQAISQDQLHSIERQARIDADAAALPALTGSEKQISWADSIRRQALYLHLRAMRCMMARIEASGVTLSDTDVAQKLQIDAKFDAVLTTTSSKFWIDNRGKNIPHCSTAMWIN